MTFIKVSQHEDGVPDCVHYVATYLDAVCMYRARGSFCCCPSVSSIVIIVFILEWLVVCLL